MLTNEILSSIDNIDECVMEAEMNVLNAMINEYDKAIMIMENYNGNDYSSFDVFMEADESTSNNNSNESKKKSKLDGPILGSKGENIIKRILLVIPRLIATLVRSIKNKWDNRKSQRLIKKIEELESTIRLHGYQVTDLQERTRRHTGDIDELNKKIQHNNDVAESLDKRMDLAENQIKNLQSDVGNASTKSYQMSRNLNKVKRAIDFMNGTVKTEMNFDTAKSYLQDVLKMIETLEKFDPYKPSSIGKDVMNKVNEDLNAREHLRFDLKIEHLKFDLKIYEDEPISYKLNDVKKYVKEISDLRDQITDRGTKLVEKMSKITTDINKAYEGKKDTKGHRDTINNCQTVLKYTHLMASEGQIIDTYVTNTFDKILDTMSRVQSMINDGLYDPKF